MCAHEQGKIQHSAFVKECLESQRVSFYEPIKMNKIALPINRHTKKRSKCFDSTKDDIHLLGQLYISLQVREGNSDRLFIVENTDAANAALQGYKHILIIANDTDVIVLGISFFTRIGAEKLWVSFGMGKKLRYISIHDIIHDICNVMSPIKRMLSLHFMP